MALAAGAGMTCYLSQHLCFATNDVERHGLVSHLGPGVLAFGLHGQVLRLVTDAPWPGAPHQVTIHPPLTRAVLWVHRVDGAPLQSPWTSHRDLLDLRRAPWFDGARLRSSVSAASLSALLPGPSDGPPPDLTAILCAAAECQGRLPGHPDADGLAVQLALERGFGSRELAHALGRSPRRIRQLAGTPQPLLDLGRRALLAGAHSSRTKTGVPFVHATVDPAAVPPHPVDLLGPGPVH